MARESQIPAVPSSAPGTGRGGQLSWIALGVAGLLTVWHVIFAVTVQGMAGSDQDVFVSVWLVVSLVLAVGCGVVGFVADSQKTQPLCTAVSSIASGNVIYFVVIHELTSRYIYFLISTLLTPL